MPKTFSFEEATTAAPQTFTFEEALEPAGIPLTPERFAAYQKTQPQIQPRGPLGEVAGQPDNQLLSSVVNSFVPNPPTAQELRQREIEKAAGVTPIPLGTRIAAGLDTGISQGAATPGRLVHAGADLAMGAVGAGNTRLGRWNADMLRQYADYEARMQQQDVQTFGPNDIPNQLASGTGRAAVELPLTIAPGMGAANAEAAVARAAAAGGVVGGGTQYAQDRGAGMSRTEAMPYAAASGLATALVTRAFGASGVEAIFAKEGAPGIINRLRAVATGFGMEFGEELSDQALQDLNERLSRNPEKPIGDTVKELLMAGAVGGILGGGVSTVSQGMQAAGEVAEERAFDRASTAAANETALQATFPERNPNQAALDAAPKDFNQRPKTFTFEEAQQPLSQSQTPESPDVPKTTDSTEQKTSGAVQATSPASGASTPLTISNIQDSTENQTALPPVERMPSDAGFTHSTMARSYFFDGGPGVMISTGYLANAIAGAFPRASSRLWEVFKANEKAITDTLGDIRTLVVTEHWAKLRAEIVTAVESSYGVNTAEARAILDAMLDNPTGVTFRDGARLENRLDALESEQRLAPTPAKTTPSKQSQVRAELAALPGANEDLNRTVPALTTEQTDAGLREAPSDDNVPATKADLIALAQFIEKGGPNPFASKAAPVSEGADTLKGGEKNGKEVQRQGEGGTAVVPADQPTAAGGVQPTTPPAFPGSVGSRSSTAVLPDNEARTAAAAQRTAPEKPSFAVGQRVVVKLSDRAGKEHMARITQLQPDGSAQVQIDGEKVQRWVKPNQLLLTKTDAARVAKATELASVPAERQAQTKADAAEFDRLVEDYAPQLDWAPGEVYDRNTVMQEQGVANGKLRATARQRAARAAGVPMYQDNSLTDRAAALPKLEAYLRQQFPGDNSIAKRRVLEQFSRSEADPEQTATVKRDQATLDQLAANRPNKPEFRGLKAVGRTVSRGQPAVRGRGAGSGVLSSAGASTVTELERIFGVRIIFVENARFNGVRLQGTNLVLINAKAPRATLAIAGHELLHHIKAVHPGLYADFVAQARTLLRNSEQFRAELARKGYANLTEAIVAEEMFADVLGDAVLDPAFLQQLAKSEPNLFKRFARTAVTWLQKLIAKAKALTGFDSAQYVTDLEAMRHELLNLLRDAGRETQYQKAGIEQETSNIQHPTSNAEGEGQFSQQRMQFSNATITAPGVVDLGDRFSLTAHHGTPHKVDKFTTAKIGTGEGAQVYGWGLYFAENEKVAESYAETLSDRYREQRAREGETRLNEQAKREGLAVSWSDDRGRFYLRPQMSPGQSAQYDTTEIEAKASETLRAAIAQANSSVYGNKYTVELNADQEDLLDWDKPLREQSEKVRKALGPTREYVQAYARRTIFQNLEKFIVERIRPGAKFSGGERVGVFDTWEAAMAAATQYYSNEATGQMLYSYRNEDAETASQELLKAGIKGIRYLDQGSRGTPMWFVNLDDGSSQHYDSEATANKAAVRARENGYTATVTKNQTYNYVIFSDDDITITHENGQEVGARDMFSMEGGDLFGAPESVEEQKERESHEKAQKAQKEKREAMQERAGARLVGKDLDTTKEMFGAEVKRDKSGQGDMFSLEKKAQNEVAAAKRGELEAFHGSPEGTFQQFNESERGIFFTNKADLAEGYTFRRGIWRSPGKTPKVYHANLTMRNPLVIEAGGARNNNLPFPGQEYKRTVFGNLPSNAVSVADAATKAFAMGHDGVIIRDVMDANDVTDKTRSTVYVVKSPDQIQPAGDMFSKERVDSNLARNHIDPVSKLYEIETEEIQNLLKNGQKPYKQQDFGLFDLPQANLPGQPEPGHSLKTFDPDDLRADFARGDRISSVDQSKAPPSVPTYNVNGTIINSPADFARTLIGLRSPNNESLKIVILDDTNKVVHSEVLYAGTVDTISVDSRDFLRLFEKHKAQGTRMLMSHNHPSGDPEPSSADNSFTSKVRVMAGRAGFEVKDHVITNGDRYYSYEAYGTQYFDKADVVKAPWEKVPRRDLRLVDNSDALGKLVATLRQGNNQHAHIIYLTTRMKVTAIERVNPGNDMADALRRAVVRGIGTEAARCIMVDFGPDVPPSNANTMAAYIRDWLKGSDTPLVDWAANGTLSAKSAGWVMADAKNEATQERGDMFSLPKPEDQSEFAQLQADITAAEAELMTAIRQHMNPPAGMRKAEALEAKNDAHRKLRDLLRQQLKMMTDIRNLDAARSPEETANLISQTVDLLNSIQDDISERNAKSEAVPEDLTKLRTDLQERLAMLKGWTDSQEDEARAGKVEKQPRRDDRFTELESASDPERNGWPQFLAKLQFALKKITSPIPELPLTGPRATTSALFRRGYRLFAVENNRVRKEAAEKVNRVVEPIVKLGRKPADNEALARYYKLHNALQRAEMDAPRRAAILKQMRALEESTLNKDPFNLFRKLVLYKDLRWRATYLKNDQGKPITLPLGLTVDEVGAELRRTYQQIEQHPDGLAITEALRRHYALTDELQKSIIEHGEIIPESLKNPLYFPHHIADNWTGRLDRVRPKTEEDFRRYLIAPKGSPKLIQTDYLKAMLLHTADVMAHNARVDLVTKYWQPYDISEQLKAQHGEAWTMPWNIPPGYKLYAPYKKLALRMDYILSREVLAEKLGVLFNDGDLRARMGDTGKVVKVTPEDLHAALVAGEKIQWALPEEIADALDGIDAREKAATNPGIGHDLAAPVRYLHRRWKQVKLFAPWSWLRYEYGNLTTDVIDKVLIADPGTAKQMARARKEIWNADKGEQSPEFKAALREGILETITEGEMANLSRLPEFEAFQTPAERRASKARAFGQSTMRGSRFREQVFRYAKFLADVERLRAGKQPVFGGAYHGDITALGQDVDGQRRMLDGEELIYAQAAEISLKTYGDYESISVFSQFLRTYIAPFWSWQDVNFRYHANLLRNVADALAARTMPKSEAARLIGGATVSALSKAAFRVGVMLFLYSAAQELWNRVGGPLLGLWDDDDDLEGKLSEADRRKSHIILGQDKNGKVLVAYTPGAFADVAEWVGGTNLKRLFMEYTTGQITLDVMIRDYAKSLGGDFLNKAAQGASPAIKVFYEGMSGKATFPDVLDQRNIPESEKYWRLVGQLTDDRAVNVLRGAFDKDYYSIPASEQLQQIILQIRRRDPLQWSYYEAKEDAAEWKFRKTGKKFDQGDYTAPEAVALRNFRKAIYRGDVVNAQRFYDRLLQFGYTADRLDDSIRTQAPLSVLNEEQRAEYVKTLTPKQKQELELATQYYNRIKALDGREKQLFPKKGQQPSPKPELLKRIVEEQKR